VRGKCIAATLVVVVALAVGGCGRPAGVDGNLTDDWTGFAAAKLPVPAQHACYPTAWTAKRPAAIDCGLPHNVETVKVGTLAGEDASKDRPPAGGSPAQQAAYADCSQAARDFVGGDWRDGRLGLDVVFPTATQWDAEGRWYLCDLVEFKDLDSFDVASRTGSVQGSLAGARPLALTCFTVTTKADDIDAMTATDCGAAHNAEYAGIWDAPPGPYPADAAAREKAQLDGCRRIVATYTGIPDDAQFRYRVGQITYGFAKADWDLGNRGSRCYLWMSEKTFTRSLKGAGTSGLPINYA
jgi:hypothetical protein